MKVDFAPVPTGKRSRKTNNIAAFIVNPYAPDEPPLPHACHRLNIEHRSLDFAKELLTNVSEIIVLPIEIRRVDEHHVHEAVRRKLQFKHARHPVYEALRTREHAFLLCTLFIKMFDEASPEINASQEIFVRHRDIPQLRIGPHVLDVGLDQRGVLLNNLEQKLFLERRLINQSSLL